MLSLSNMLNPAPGTSLEDDRYPLTPDSLSPHTPTRSAFPQSGGVRATHRASRRRASPTGNRPRGKILFPPHESLDDHSLREYRKFGVTELGAIHEFCRHVPYKSDKREFSAKTDREGFEAFEYTVREPVGGKEFTISWDSNIGLVRMTPFFKMCGYLKTAPSLMMDRNPGLKAISHNITGGSIPHQGYWSPYSCARAVCATFCYKIAGALIPLFGPDFPSICVPDNHEGFGRLAIDPAIVLRAAEEAERFRALYGNIESSSSSSSSSSAARATARNNAVAAVATARGSDPGSRSGPPAAGGRRDRDRDRGRGNARYAPRAGTAPSAAEGQRLAMPPPPPPPPAANALPHDHRDRQNPHHDPRPQDRRDRKARHRRQATTLDRTPRDEQSPGGATAPHPPPPPPPSRASTLPGCCCPHCDLPPPPPPLAPRSSSGWTPVNPPAPPPSPGGEAAPAAEPHPWLSAMPVPVPVPRAASASDHLQQLQRPLSGALPRMHLPPPLPGPGAAHRRRGGGGGGGSGSGRSSGSSSLTSSPRQHALGFPFTGSPSPAASAPRGADRGGVGPGLRAAAAALNSGAPAPELAEAEAACCLVSLSGGGGSAPVPAAGPPVRRLMWDEDAPLSATRDEPGGSCAARADEGELGLILVIPIGGRV